MKKAIQNQWVGFLAVMLLAISITASVVLAAPKVEITAWDLTGNMTAIRPVYDEIFADFEKANPDIKVKHMDVVSTNDRQIFVTAMAGGNGPDVYDQAHFPVIGDWVKQKFCLDLTPFWKNYADKDQFIPSSMTAATIRKKVYGVPVNMYIMGLLYNKTRFKEAGLDPSKPPKNWTEFAQYGQKLTNRSKQQYGNAILGMDWANWWFEYYVWQAGGDLSKENADGTCTLTLNSKATIAALQYYKDLKWKYQVCQDNVLQGFDENRNDFIQGRAAMILAATDWFAWLASSGVDFNTIGFAPFPVGPSGKGPSQTGGAYWIINPQSSKAKQLAAWKYITYMESKPVLEKLLKYQSDNGILPNLLTVRKDVKVNQFVKGVPEELAVGVQQAGATARQGHFLYEKLTPYIVKSVQKILTDKNADPKVVLDEAQVAAQREVVEPFNAEVKKGQ